MYAGIVVCGAIIVYGGIVFYGGIIVYGGIVFYGGIIVYGGTVVYGGIVSRTHAFKRGTHNAMDAVGVAERSPVRCIHSPCSTRRTATNGKKQKKKEKSPMDSSASAAGHHHLRAPRNRVCTYSRHAANASRSAQTKQSDCGMAIRLAHAGRQDHSVLQIADMLPRIAQKYCAARNGSADLRSVASNPPARRDTGPPSPQMPSLLSPVGRGLLFIDGPIAYSPENSSE